MYFPSTEEWREMRWLISFRQEIVSMAGNKYIAAAEFCFIHGVFGWIRTALSSYFVVSRSQIGKIKTFH